MGSDPRILLSPSPDEAHLVISGKDAKVVVGGNVRMKNATARIEFEIPATGFADVPLSANGFSDTVEGASIVVRADRNWPAGSRQVLVRSVSALGGELANLRLLSENKKIRVRCIGNEIVASNVAGLVVLVR